MKRLHILLLVLLIVGVATRVLIDKEQAPLVLPFSQPIQQVTTGALLSGDNVGTTGDLVVATGNVDDTELPLDQNGGDMPQDDTEQATDAEVEEIINLLEELIAENEGN